MTFPPLLMQACQLALERGIYFQDQFVNFVIDCYGFGCTAQLLGHVVISDDVANRAQHDRDLFTRLDDEVKRAPRGAYITVERQFRGTDAPVRRTFRTIVSDGTGSIATGGKYDFYDTLPSSDMVLRAMITDEIALCRQHAERLKHIADGRFAIRRFGLQAGKQYAGVTIPGNLKSYPCVTIAKVDYEHGEVRVYLSRRDANAKAVSIMSAYNFAAYAGLDHPHVQFAPPRAYAGDDLFSQPHPL